jgi:ribonuclease P protein subunit RPR2
MRYAGRRGHSVLPEVRRDDSPRRSGGGHDPVLRRATDPSRLVRALVHPSVALSVAAAERSDRPAPAELEILPELQQRDIGHFRRMSRMRGPGSSRRRGRRGRRSAAMIRAAQERIQDLFSLAETEVYRSPDNLSQRYVTLARRIGMRYNVRLLREYRDVYCRGCSSFWVEGRSVRTRLRAGRRTQTCLRCGRIRRLQIKHAAAGPPPADNTSDRRVRREQAVLIDDGMDDGLGSDHEEGEEE